MGEISTKAFEPQIQHGRQNKKKNKLFHLSMVWWTSELPGVSHRIMSYPKATVNRKLYPAEVAAYKFNFWNSLLNSHTRVLSTATACCLPYFFEGPYESCSFSNLSELCKFSGPWVLWASFFPTQRKMFQLFKKKKNEKAIQYAFLIGL